MHRTRFPPLTFPRLWLALAAVTAGMAALLSIMPNPPRGIGPVEGDKDTHAVIYMLLTIVWLQVSRARLWLLTMGVVLALGTALEFAQLLTPTRIFHAADLIANALGVIAGGLLCWSPLGQTLGLLDHGLARLLKYR